MTSPVPPLQLHIKRKKGEEPVDSIYIQADAQQQKRRRFTDFVFKRLTNDEDPTSPSSKRSASPRAGARATARRSSLNQNRVPLVRTTKPGDELENKRTKSQKAEVNIRGSAAAAHSEQQAVAPVELRKGPAVGPPSLTPSGRGSPAKRPSISNLRRFHLTTSPSLESLNTRLGGGVRKRSKKTGNNKVDIPVLVERIKAKNGIPGARTKAVEFELKSGDTKGSGIPPAADLQTDLQKSSVLPTSDDATNNLSQEKAAVKSQQEDDLLKELYDWAEQEHTLEETRKAVPSHSSVQADKSEMDVDPSNSIEDDDEKDYVYDVYLRYAAEGLGEGTGSSDPTTGASKPENAGIIIIDSENQDQWEMYLEDGDGSDSEYGDEDSEDENAENWHGNDYPDDPYSSDDSELGDHYKEYDSDDEGVWSAGEDDRL
ncbi:MAG: hypothetical protein M4579_001564 [Chaenotheca gracillima]|nr:MAG: hypothetical protein M4579_001564 [Chaenotheca gracillima]